MEKAKSGGRGNLANTSRIAKNTLFLYFWQLLIMLVSLYTVCVVLATLGVEDYGIYKVVAVMFGFVWKRLCGNMCILTN